MQPVRVDRFVDCVVARGTFVGRADARCYFPPGLVLSDTSQLVPVPEEGAPHTFVRFFDGSIADLTADQVRCCQRRSCLVVQRGCCQRRHSTHLHLLSVCAWQFDPSFPRVWWPADPACYRVGAKGDLRAAVAKHLADEQQRSAPLASRERTVDVL